MLCMVPARPGTGGQYGSGDAGLAAGNDTRIGNKIVPRGDRWKQGNLGTGIISIRTRHFCQTSPGPETTRSAYIYTRLEVSALL